MRIDTGIQTKPGGSLRFGGPLRNRVWTNTNKTAIIRNQKSCDHASAPNPAHTVAPIGAIAHAHIANALGAAVEVRLGTIVNRNPTAKHIKNPWICAIEWYTRVS